VAPAVMQHQSNGSASWPRSGSDPLLGASLLEELLLRLVKSGDSGASGESGESTAVARGGRTATAEEDEEGGVG
jgi:hypothetical protein